MRTGFDQEKYTKLQSEHIAERIEHFGGKLYLEFGGKLFDDHHASRVLPGFSPDAKIRMLTQLKDQAEVVIVINANDIEKSKIRGDLGITYDLDVLRLIDAFRGFGLYVGSVVLTRFAGQSAAEQFEQRLQALGVKVYRHYPIAGYPTDVSHIVSEEGFGRNDYIETTRPLVVVTAPGPGSGKMATCLSQVYHEHRRGLKAGYAKFETFPIWNLPLKHPINVAYEAATADLSDVNMIDPFHLEAYGTTTVNYNRDIEIFPVLNALFERVWGESPYRSPTDMGVNMIGYCISDDAVCRAAARQEIIRRWFAARCANLDGLAPKDQADKIELLMRQLNIIEEERPVIKTARQRQEQTGQPALAIQLSDGELVTGKTSPLMGPSAAVILNALKRIAGIEKSVHLIPPEVIEPVQELKCHYLGNHNPRLHSNEVLIALSVSAATSPAAAKALAALPQLKDCEAHATVMLSAADADTFRRLGIRVTNDPVYQGHKLFHK